MSVASVAQQHLIPHFTTASTWRGDDLPVLVRGDGPWVWDEQGTRYLDGQSGLFCTNIGHGRKDFAAVAAQQMETLSYAPNWSFTHPPAAEASALIASLAPGDLERVFFVNSGSEAVESALKLARSYYLARGETQRYKVIAREWAYHGSTLGALSVTGVPGVREPFAPLLWSGVRHVPTTLGAVIPEGGSAADLDCVRAVEQAILDEGPESVAMVIAEPVQNARGALVPPEGYWTELRRICDRYGVLLCADEVITSFGRVGHWFASARFGAEPDLITFAKGVTSAYLPLGGVVTRPSLIETIYDSELGSFVHGATFGAHPVVTAVAVANIEAMRSERVLDNVLAKQDGLGRRLREVAAGRRVVKEVRGTGFLHYLELMADRESGRELGAEERAELQGGVLAGFLREAALAVRPDGRGGTMIPVAPPLICDDATLDELASRLDQVLSRTESWLDARK